MKKEIDLRNNRIFIPEMDMSLTMPIWKRLQLLFTGKVSKVKLITIDNIRGKCYIERIK